MFWLGHRIDSIVSVHVHKRCAEVLGMMCVLCSCARIPFYEIVVVQIRSVLREARGMGAERFFLTRDFNLESRKLTGSTFRSVWDV